MSNYDYSKLIGKIIETYNSRLKFAEEFGISSQALNEKLHGRSGFSQEDIERCCKLLKIQLIDIGYYFFSKTV